MGIIVKRGVVVVSGPNGSVTMPREKWERLSPDAQRVFHTLIQLADSKGQIAIDEKVEAH